MKLETFFEKFELFADAPNAVAKMRELVLRLAMQGKLSETKDNDVPVNVLLRDIEDEKARLGIKSSAMRVREVSEKLENEMSDAIPERWTWVHFGDIARHNAGKTLDKGRNSGELRDYITTSNLYWGFFRLEDVRQMPIQDDELERCTAKKGDLLICEGGEAGRAAVWPHDYDISFQNHVHRARFYGGINPYFVQRFFEKLKVTGEIDEFRKGVGISNMSGKALASIVMPLPPIAEQQRIVAKVDELMALCDRLEAQQRERGSCQAALARASLARFAEAPTLANLDFLFHKSYAITPADLRKSILTLAVQGKLIPQDPNDESAESCLSRLGLNSSLTPSDGTNGADGSAPPSWSQVKFEDIALVAGGVTLGRKLGIQKMVTLPYLRVANVKRGEIDLGIVKEISIAEDEIERYALHNNDLLMTEGGDWDKVGRAAIWKAQIPICLHQNHVFRARMRSIEIDPAWFERYFNSPDGRRYFESASKQTTNLASINMRQVRGCPVPFPPLAEQRRIVAKVDQLMALVDQLESQLSQAKAKSITLLDAVIHELLNPTSEVIDLASYRAAIGCYAIQKMQDKAYFGRTAAMKVLYLAEAHVGLKLGLKPLREAAGPFDKWIYSFEKQGQKEHWFKVNETSIRDGKTKVEYQVGPEITQKSVLVEKIFSVDQRKELDRLLGLLSDKNTEEAEIIATLFAAWNDFLIDGQTPSDDEIVREVRENWHQKKARFTPTQLTQWIGWLRQNNLIPQGRLPRTAYQQQLISN